MAHKLVSIPARYGAVHHKDKNGKDAVAKGGDLVWMDEEHAAQIGAEEYAPPDLPAPPPVEKPAKKKGDADAPPAAGRE